MALHCTGSNNVAMILPCQHQASLAGFVPTFPCSSVMLRAASSLQVNWTKPTCFELPWWSRSTVQLTISPNS